MVKIKWVAKEEKRIEIKEKGVAATLHFFEGAEISFPENVWEVVSKKLSDDIFCQRIIMLDSSKKEKSKTKTKQEKDIEDYLE